MRIALLLLLLLMLLRWCLFAASWEFAADLILLYLVFTGVQGNGLIPGRLCRVISSNGSPDPLRNIF